MYLIFMNENQPDSWASTARTMEDIQRQIALRSGASDITRHTFEFSINATDANMLSSKGARLLTHVRGGAFLSDFNFISDFLSVSEQRTLLSAALLRLDATGSRRFQKKRKSFIASSKTAGLIAPAQMFLPDECYEFSEVRAVYNAFSN